MPERLIAEFRKSVRPLTTLMLVAGVIYGFMEKLISAEAFMGLAILVVKYWFDERAKPTPPNGGTP